ncbi:unnamed protein product [Rotaria magnacalcarata]|nr:unnamed protein product [Rotaria magnacalcarata]
MNKVTKVDRLGRVLYGRNYNQDIIQSATIIAKKRACSNTCDFCSYVELICHELQVNSLANRGVSRAAEPPQQPSFL